MIVPIIYNCFYVDGYIETFIYVKIYICIHGSDLLSTAILKDCFHNYPLRGY